MLDKTPLPDSAVMSTDKLARAFVSGAASTFGSMRRAVDSLAGLEPFFADQGLPALPDLFGMEWFHEAAPDQTRWTLAAQSAAMTLAQSGTSPGDVDGLVFCSAHFPDTLDGSANGLQRVMQELDLSPAFVTGLTLGRCTSFLSGLHLATGLVEAGQYRNILVICADTYDSDAARLQPFALFSDGAASCLVGASAGQDCRFAIRGSATGSDPDSFDPAGRINPAMVTQVNDRITARTGIPFDQITAFLPINIYRPVVFAAETQGGVPADRLFLDNIPAKGHCFGADPLINLIDRDIADPLAQGDYALLCASVPGFRAALLVQVL